MRTSLNGNGRVEEHRMIAPRLALVFVTVVLAFAGGCNQANSLEGAVTYNDEPVESGAISFRSSDGTGPGFGAQIVSGKYRVEKSRPGKHVVSIRGVDKKLAPQSTEEAIQKFNNAKAAGKETLDHYGQPTDYIPENAEGNGKTVDIDSGKRTLDFELKGPPRSK
jgi:hypothetical protein